MRIDGRTLSHETSETIRRLAVRRVQEGERLLLDRAADAVEALLTSGLADAQNAFHGGGPAGTGGG